MIIRRLTLPLLAVLALAGCANGASDDSAGAPAPASATPSSAVPTEKSSASKPAEPGSKTITGTITAGVEPGCLLLDDHLLIIKDAALKPVAKVGASVTATGHAEPGMMTTCQQGTPFVVTTIRAN
ncbi:hypothetical protein [Actinoplanes sp. NPDC049118]|uniref:hypothetical protein n=1 Tax=Actinoplanes sp. NPDC049118 TaxID=3155769 RepID=UPI0033E7D2FA